MKAIPYGRQAIDDADVAAVVEVLKSDFLTQGPTVPRFEAAVAEVCQVPHAIAGNSATSMLHLACLALGLGPGKRLWTVPNTFVASANCALYCGADVDFVDIHPETWTISLPALEAKLTAARHAGQLPDVVVPVDFGGLPVDTAAMAALGREFGFKIIEDASHSIGASRDGVPVGSAHHADIVVFSFHPVKIITTAEGGMATTRRSDLAEKMALLRTHGITRDPEHMQGPSPGRWYYEQIELGFNYRMTDLQAALGLSQLARLQQFVERRNVLAERYRNRLDGLPLTFQRVDPGTRSAFHLFVVRLIAQRCRRSHAEIFEQLRGSGIGVNLHYMPVHLQPFYRAKGFAPGICPEAERYGNEALTIPLHPSMTDAEHERVCVALEAAI